MSEENDRMIQQLRIENVDANHMTVVQQQIVSDSMLLRGKAGKQRKRYHVMEKMLWDLMAALPDPKLKSLEKLVVLMAYESFGNQKNAAGYLGIAQAKVSQVISGDAGRIKKFVGEALWNKQQTVPMEDDRIKKLNAGEEVKMILPAEIDKLQEAIKSGAVIVREINRNEL